MNNQFHEGLDGTILVILLAFLVNSCSENIQVSGTSWNPVPFVPTENQMINHFLELTSPDATLPDGRRARFEPARWRRDVIRVYFDDSVSEMHRRELNRFMEELTSHVNSNELSFEISNDLNDFDIGIVHGTPDYKNEVFGTSHNPPPTTWWGGTIGERECTTITKKYIWYNPPRLIINTLKHEFLHAVGFHHASSGLESMMYHSIPDNSEVISELDIVALKLLYYNGQFGMVSKLNEDDDCTLEEYYLFEEELDLFTSRLESIIANDFN